MNIDERTREAIVSNLKAEANKLDLTGDAFWAHVWHGVEAACIESGDLPRSRRRPAPKVARSA